MLLAITSQALAVLAEPPVCKSQGSESQWAVWPACGCSYSRHAEPVLLGCKGIPVLQPMCRILSGHAVSAATPAKVTMYYHGKFLLIIRVLLLRRLLSPLFTVILPSDLASAVQPVLLDQPMLARFARILSLLKHVYRLNRCACGQQLSSADFPMSGLASYINS